MPVTPVDGANYFGAKPATPKAKLDMDTFMRLLTVQLANQNPLEPMNDRDFFAQMAQLGTVQGLDQMKSSLDVTKAQGLMGKLVTAVRPQDASNVGTTDTVTGTVKSMTVKNGDYYLGIQEPNGGIVQVKMDAIISVSPNNDINAMSSMIGKQVKGFVEQVEPNGQKKVVEFEGRVKSVTLKNGQYYLTVENDKGQKVQMLADAVTSVGQ